MSLRYLTAFLSTTTLLWSGLVSAALAQSADARTGVRNDATQPEVGVEVRLLRMPESVVERIGIDFHRTSTPVGQKDAPAVVFLNDLQVFQIMEAMQGDPRTNVMQAPKLTLFDRQSSTLTIGERQWFVTGIDVRWDGQNTTFLPHNEPCFLGLEVQVQPTVSADRHFIRLKFKAKDTILASPAVPLSPVTVMVTPVSQDGTREKPVPVTPYLQQPRISTIAVESSVSLPDGGTAVFFGGKRKGEGPDQFGPAVLSKMPYVNRLFRNVQKTPDAECELFMVTPRIIINQEEEARATIGETNQP
jgi:type II secretory pathway component GspD/PulD (secretin)